jgi:hypothetical protein
VVRFALVGTTVAALAAPAMTLASGTQVRAACGLVSAGSHKYFVLASGGVSCATAKTTAAKLAVLKPKPLAPGAKTGTVPGPTGEKCIATLGPGNIQLNGGCSKGGAVLIQWDRAS